MAGSIFFLLTTFFLFKRDFNAVLHGALLTIVTASVCFHFLQSAIGLIVLGGLIGVYIFLYLVDKRYRNVIKTKSEYFFLIWLGYAFIQMTSVVQTSATQINMKALLFGVAVIFLTVRLIYNTEWLEKFYKIWGFSLLGTIIVALWEISTNNHLPSSGAIFYRLDNVATAGFFNPNDFSFFLILSLPVIFHWIKQKGRYRLFGGFMFLSDFYINYVNGARFMLLLFILASFAFMISLVKNNKKLLALFITVFTVISFFNIDTIKESIEITSSLSESDSSNDIRKLLAIGAWNIFKNNLFGVGPGNAPYYMDLYGVSVGTLNVVHNFWLEVLVNYGFFIFMGIVIFFTTSVYKMFKAVRTSDNLRSSISPLLWSSVLFIPACIESSSIFTFSITWFFFGLMICAVNVINKEQLIKKSSKYYQ